MIKGLNLKISKCFFKVYFPFQFSVVVWLGLGDKTTWLGFTATLRVGTLLDVRLPLWNLEFYFWGLEVSIFGRDGGAGEDILIG